MTSLGGGGFWAMGDRGEQGTGEVGKENREGRFISQQTRG